MHGDVIDVLSQLRIKHPDVPGLGGADRLPGCGAHVLEMRNKIGAREVAAKQDLVADHDAHDVAVFLREPDRLLDLALVAGAIGIEPRAERHADAAALRERRHFAHGPERAVGADSVGLALEHA